MVNLYIPSNQLIFQLFLIQLCPTDVLFQLQLVLQVLGLSEVRKIPEKNAYLSKQK
jgi:hypothetical protein